MKGLVHVLVPYQSAVACGTQGYSANAMFRDAITCKRCRKTELFKKLPALPRKYRPKGKK